MMEIKKLVLDQFRNYKHLEISFNQKINVFIGNNAQGKTTLLESIYLLAISKSHKTHKDKELIQFDYPFTRVKANLMKSDSDFDLEVIISNQGKKVSINNIEKKKISEYIGAFNVVMFAPEDLDIVKKDPANRRKFLDVEIGQISSIYIYDLNQYNKILKQRNEYLKLSQQNNNFDEVYLDSLSKQLATYGEKIISRRLSFIHKLNQYASVLHHYISGQKEQLAIDYQSTYKIDNQYSVDSIFEQYKKNYKLDRYRGTTTIGPHRDDLRFLVNGIDVSSFGSQGQQRTTALALKLSLIDFIKDETNQYPIVLLDDVLSELDDTRQTQLLDCIKEKVQTFVTTTNISGIKNEILEKADIFYIENAQIFKRKEGVINGK
jgi:DNA replication and repair protein RecF